MAKFHINKHGVPAPCKATKGNCPYGGESGTENHYDTQEEAQVAADKANEEKHGILPNVPQPKTTENMRDNFRESMQAFEGKQVKVNYDEKDYEGEVESIYMPSVGSDKTPGFIVRGHDEHGAEQFKHIKVNRIENITDKENGQGPEGLLKDAISKKKLYGVVSNRNGISHQEFSIADKGNNIFAKNVQLYENEEDAIEQVQVIEAERQAEETMKAERKERLNKFAKENFYRKPSMSDRKFDKYKERLAYIEKSINEKLKDKYPNFRGIYISDDPTSESKIRINGSHKDIKSYFYGNSVEFDFEKHSEDEVVAAFEEAWDRTDNKEHFEFFERFIRDGEKWGWD